MRLRRIDANGDMVFGSGQADYWHNVPEGIAQWCQQRLRLNTGEWFVDLNEGTPWATEVLGERTRATRDLVVRDRVANTPGVSEIVAYGSVVEPNTRTWAAGVRINTVFGVATVFVPLLPADLPPLAAAPPTTGYARLLGVTGTAATPVAMTPADLSVPDRTDISDFRMLTVDGQGNP